MNKSNAKLIASSITFEQLEKMFVNAKANIKDWTKTSAVNKSITKGAAWNILFPSLNRGIMLHPMAVKNMIWEFGDHLENNLQIKKSIKEKRNVKITHQEPKF